jgi:small-conductance mechanosensitive channel
MAAFIAPVATKPFTQWLATHGSRILGIVVGASIISWIANAATNRLHRRLEQARRARGGGQAERATTVTKVLLGAVLVALWAVVLVLVLSEVGVDIAPILASAGVVGVALGFGAQSLVRDFLAGLFILMEDQFEVGDTVQIASTGGTVVGTVDSLTLRITILRTQQGSLTVVPNGNIQLLENRSRAPLAAQGPGESATDEVPINPSE